MDEQDELEQARKVFAKLGKLRKQTGVALLDFYSLLDSFDEMRQSISEMISQVKNLPMEELESVRNVAANYQDLQKYVDEVFTLRAFDWEQVKANIEKFLKELGVESFL